MIHYMPWLSDWLLVAALLWLASLAAFVAVAACLIGTLGRVVGVMERRERDEATRRPDRGLFKP